MRNKLQHMIQLANHYLQFVRLLDGQDLVLCSADHVSPKEIKVSPEYEITTGEKLDDVWHMAWVESTLTHFMQQHSSQVNDSEINTIIAGIPKRVANRSDKPGREFGYGIRSVQGWSLVRFVGMAVMCIILGLVFFCAWLGRHPGDFQNASIPYF